MKKPKQSTSNQDQSDALEALGRKVQAAQDAQNPEIEAERKGWAIGIRYASDFSAAVIVGGLLGFGFDKLAKTTPWGLLVGIIFGFMAGTRNIVRTAKELSAENGTGQGSQED
jgi:ATP synthase protein I